jgi:ribosomal protein S18 acetylase RimI-like enzyme
VTGVEIRPVVAADRSTLDDFFRRIPEGDRTLFKEDVLAPATGTVWTSDRHGRRLAAVDGDVIVGCAAVIPGLEWSSHVGELRVVVDPDHRRKGVGRALARRGLLEALDLRLVKIVVEVIADQAPAIALFRALGFEPEALLRDHVRDRAGNLHDLMVLSHDVEDRWSQISTVGIDDALP